MSSLSNIQAMPYSSVTLRRALGAAKKSRKGTYPQDMSLSILSNTEAMPDSSVTLGRGSKENPR
jgi:hypothetical protein